MNLVIDMGNTMVKYAVFNGYVLLFDNTSEHPFFDKNIKKIFDTYPEITHAILSSVAHLDKNQVNALAVRCKLHLLSPESKTPFKNKYATPKTLGVDRVALVTAAFYYNQKGSSLIIDMGTCITYDILNADGEYLGGSIAPGLRMRFKAMHEQTASLPLLEPEFPLDFMGNTTTSSMQSGVFNGILYELEATIDLYKKHFEHLTVILTGGDSHFFAKRLKNSIFAHSKFLLEGLNYLLEYNKR